MAGDLAAEERALLAHPALEECVADPVAVRPASRRGDRVLDGAARADVVEDRLARVAAQERAREQRGDEVAGRELSAVVDEEAAVGVAVEDDPEVGAALAHLLDDQIAVFRQQRVRPVAGEGPVRSPEEGLQREVETLEDRADRWPGHSVAAVGDDPQSGDFPRVDEREDLLAVGLAPLDRLDAAAAPGAGGRPATSSSRIRSMPRRRRAPARPPAGASRPCIPAGCARRCRRSRRQGRASRRGSRRPRSRPGRRRARARPRQPVRRGSAR